MTIILVTNASFPIGMAVTNRMTSLAKGLLINGHDVSILCVKPTEKRNNIFNKERKGILSGIPYSYTGSPIRSDSFLIRRWMDFYSGIRSLSVIFRASKRSKNLAVSFSDGAYPFFEFSLALICKFLRIAIYKQETEHPSIYFSKNIWGKYRYIYQTRVVYRLYDLIFVMTDNLVELLVSFGIRKSKIYKLKNCIDLDLFNHRKSYNSDIPLSLPKEYLAYAGSLDDKKDGVVSFLQIYEQLIDKFPELFLVVIGSGSREELEIMTETMTRLKISHRVLLTNRVPSDIIPVLLSRAKALVSYRPDSVQAYYGFPTKILEYLATGLPVFTTLTGELHKYLSDGVNSYGLEFGNNLQNVKKIEDVLSNRDKSMEVGNNGQLLVKEYFDSKVIAKEFVSNIVDRKKQII